MRVRIATRPRAGLTIPVVVLASVVTVVSLLLGLMYELRADANAASTIGRTTQQVRQTLSRDLLAYGAQVYAQDRVEVALNPVHF
ncbi:MAG: hypothetical protein ABSD03_16435 [Vulcanimicrobiaceae bacterium]|jgi:hypothetical protein